ncbi:MAG TPA: DnaJ domain-containing protein [Polyangiaceae bacterium]|nr:DnaJ domain-containing protein [Polyangiaceae bacterium]
MPLDARDLQRIVSWDLTLDEANYYELLGVLVIADDEALRVAFHAFARAFHPDAYPDGEPDIRGRLTRIFQRGTEAYRVLAHPERRAEYDMALARGQLRLGIPSRPPPGQAVALSLEDLCRTPSARLHARQAERLISKGDLAGAREELLVAARHDDPSNAALAERLEALDLALFASGS